MRPITLSNQWLPRMSPNPQSTPGATVRSERHGPVTLVTLDRADRRNAVDPPTALALYRAMLAFEADEAASVAVLAGRPEGFCAGFDLSCVADGSAEAWLEQLHFGEGGEPPLGPMGPTRLQLSKPVIAAIAGPAVAGGMELALWCDLRVMEEDAWMGVLCRRWGVPLIDGGTVRLPRLVGAGRALDLVLTGRRVEAAECQSMGLCDRVVPTGAGVTAALALARSLAEFPQLCLRGDRLAARYGAFPDELAALQAEFRQGLAALRNEAARGARRFMQGAGRRGE